MAISYAAGCEGGAYPYPEPETTYLPDGDSIFRMVKIMSDTEADSGDAEHVVVSNGLFEDAEVLLTFGRRMLAQARNHGVSMAMYLYDSPHAGSSAYATAYRTERLARVADYVTDRREAPVRMLAHSWGSLASQEVGEQFIPEGKVRSMCDVAPAGIVSYPAEEVDAGFVTWRTMREVLAPREVLDSDAERRAIRAQIAKNAILHVVGDWHNRAANVGRAAVGILTADIADRFVELDKKLCEQFGESRRKVLACQDDPFFPGRLLRDKLLSHGFAQGDIVMATTSHNGPILYPELASTIFELLTPDLRARYHDEGQLAS